MLPNGYWEVLDEEQSNIICPNLTRKFWIDYTDKLWPTKCSIKNCVNEAKLPVVIKRANANVYGVIPMCFDCLKRSDSFKLKWVQLAPLNRNAVLPRG